MHRIGPRVSPGKGRRSARPGRCGRPGRWDRLDSRTRVIFWDPKVPAETGRDHNGPDPRRPPTRLESLETGLSAGRRVVPAPDAGFRARVHPARLSSLPAIARDRVLARDEPGGLEGVAEEVGNELVVVCGNNVGDIFRRNALPSACTSCRAPRPSRCPGRRSFSFDPGSAAHQRDRGRGTRRPR